MDDLVQEAKAFHSLECDRVPQATLLIKRLAGRIAELEWALRGMLGHVDDNCEECQSARAVLEKGKQPSSLNDPATEEAMDEHFLKQQESGATPTPEERARKCLSLGHRPKGHLEEQFRQAEQAGEERGFAEAIRLAAEVARG